MSNDGDRQASARVVRNLILAAGVFVIGGLVAAVSRTGDPEAVRGMAGPAPGAELDSYFADRAEVLEAASGTTTAVVSFTEYVADDDAPKLVLGRVIAWLVAAPGREPEVTASVGDWREEALASALADATSFEDLLPTVDDPEFRVQYEHDLASAQAAARSLEAGEPVVFGAVVTADAAQLRAMAVLPAVRLVDVVPDEVRGDPRGVRPEERVVAGQPPERP